MQKEKKSGRQSAKKTEKKSVDLETMRHTLSHVLALSVKKLYGEVKFGIGPAIDDGFYYDIDFGAKKISDKDLNKIEKQMNKIIAQKLPLEKAEKSRVEALRWARENGQPYKEELIEELPADEPITFYTLGDFEDLCRGPHLANTGQIGAFKLTRVAGAYWRGDEKRAMLTRIYGVAFADQAELDAYLARQEEAKKRDHRKLGQQMDLFCFSDLVGSGLPLFTPRGTLLRDLLNDFTQKYRLDAGYQKVCIPHIANIDLYKTSGHYEKFPEMMQFVSQESGDQLALKPVSCPHHSQIFASVPRSYKELPVKLLETTMVYRDERKGELGGLSRVRAITQDDSHVFCTDEQVGQVFGELIAAAKDLYQWVKMPLKLRLSFRDDKDGYIGTPEMWATAEKAIQAMADQFEMDYFVGIGEAAMYGPKMDFMAVDALGREWQLATVQLDYALPARFHLEYVAEDGSKKTPVMVHCALIGSIERFMSVLLEHTAGWLPIWLAPECARVLTVNNSPEVLAYTKEIEQVLQGVEFAEPIPSNQLRYSVDSSDESLGKKIKRAVNLKIPVVIVVGARDASERQLSLRLADREETIAFTGLAAFLQKLAQK